MRRWFAIFAVAVLATPAPLVAQEVPPGAQRWVATEGVATPWVFDLIMKGGTVTGQAMQRGMATAARPNPPFARAFPVGSGTIVGDTIKLVFKIDDGSGGDDRTVTFRGVRHGDTIDFARSVQMLAGGGAPGNGIFGENGASTFSASLLAPGASVPTGHLARRFAGDPIDSMPRVNVSYRGYTLDITEIDTARSRDSLLAAVHGQLDIVEAARLSDDLHSFVTSVPMVVYNGDGTPRYAAGKVRIPSRSDFPYATGNPILLHELCHAIEEKKLPDGFNNADILALYNQAKNGGHFAADAYVLSRPGEYFAVMASAYLHGAVDREPYARDSIRVKQPAMYDWLVKEFGPRP